MSDSFFTSRNQVDPQIVHSPAFFCEELIEAATRRLIKLEGPLHAATRLQRISDICSGAYVLPVEHWRTLGHATSAAPTETNKSGDDSEADEKIRILRAAVETLAAELMKRTGAKPIPETRLGRVWQRFLSVFGNPVATYWLGLAIGLYWGAIWL